MLNPWGSISAVNPYSLNPDSDFSVDSNPDPDPVILWTKVKICTVDQKLLNTCSEGASIGRLSSYIRGL